MKRFAARDNVEVTALLRAAIQKDAVARLSR